MMSDPETKELKLSQDGDIVELGCYNRDKRLRNELNDFAKPDLDGGNPERQAQNLNRIEEVYVMKCLLDNEFLELSSTNVDGIEKKEDVDDWLDTVFKSGQRVRMQYGHDDVHGFLTELNVEESSQNENALYSINFNLLVATPLNDR